MGKEKRSRWKMAYSERGAAEYGGEEERRGERREKEEEEEAHKPDVPGFRAGSVIS